jgi:hypothetical protein
LGSGAQGQVLHQGSAGVVAEVELAAAIQEQNKLAALEKVLPGKKLDNGKGPVIQGVVQYFPKALLAVSNISKYGADKYSLSYDDINWRRVEGGFNRYSDALGRHLLGEYIDGPVDPESKKLHCAMVAWNALARLELLLKELN